MTLTNVQKPAPSSLKRALSVTSSQTWDADARMPLLPSRGDGARFWDVEEHEYTDLTSCTGAAPLGMNFRPVVDAMINELNRSGGILPGTMNELRTSTAELLNQIFPCAERALFFRTGSCATSGAARLARVHTGRPLVLTSGFHGWHDWHLQYKGNPDVVNRDPDCRDFGYDLGRLQQLLEANSGRVAAVFVTPEVTCMPLDDLHQMGRMAAEHGALFVLDEIITGSRFSGGIHRDLGLNPDMITLSKGLCNGAALSAVVGREEVLLAQEDTYLGNTFMREITPFAGALVSLETLHRGGAIEHISDTVRDLAQHYDTTFVDTGLAAQTLCRGGVFHVLFEDDQVGAAFHEELRRCGVHTEHNGTHLPSAATSNADLTRVKDAVAAAALTIQKRPGSPAEPLTPGGISGEAFARFCWDAFRVEQSLSERWWASRRLVGDSRG